ncbi:3-dehydroquinate dehydratase, type I [Methanothermus fervidus DSM 2088]|uniref:3-dehydroquinate dehydratase n=1 Tax=Methanothermus fervidus (strain ATCC 43054 / DSM 2088 / JCM 10308 / V24 S) TaxID=523846 RepID=E3GWD9_METFV|nr:type I 3-dehydroquinate dehydratase [Methanothermus fervidus]ADP77904.1 3-dehydroquinate dehydratase, type I [Methanothermus fervidus DSM 2088]
MKIKICVPAFEENIDKMLESAKQYIEEGADIIELRLDALRNPSVDDIKKLMKNVDFPSIVTNRCRKEGGYFRGKEVDRIKLLSTAAKYADYTDIELSTKDKYRNRVIEVSNKSIISFHDFEKTPSENKLIKIIKKEKKIGDIAKVAVMPKNMDDVLTLLKVMNKEKNVIGIAMGELGKFTRVVAHLFGSPITFASGNIKTAPGQLDIKTTRSLIKIFEVR